MKCSEAQRTGTTRLGRVTSSPRVSHQVFAWVECWQQTLPPDLRHDNVLNTTPYLVPWSTDRFQYACHQNHQSHGLRAWSGSQISPRLYAYLSCAQLRLETLPCPCPVPHKV